MDYYENKTKETFEGCYKFWSNAELAMEPKRWNDFLRSENEHFKCARVVQCPQCKYEYCFHFRNSVASSISVCNMCDSYSQPFLSNPSNKSSAIKYLKEKAHLVLPQTENSIVTKNAEPPKITHILIHICNRKDQQKGHYLSFHPTWDDACNTAIRNITEVEQQKVNKTDILDKLKKSLYSNGDWYQIRGVATDLQWSIHPRALEKYSMNEKTRLSPPPSCMGVYIKVDRNIGNHDTVQFYVTFHTSFEKAKLYVLKMNTTDVKQQFDIKLEQGQWIKESTKIGHFFQTIPINCERAIQLDFLCFPERWNLQEH